MVALAGDPQVPLPVVLRVFNQSQIYVSLGTVIASVGLVAAAYSGLRRRFDPLLLSFATFAVLYGVRMAMFHLPVWQLGIYPRPYARIAVGLGYLVPIPAFVFFGALGLLNRVGRILIAIVSPILVLLSLLTLTLGLRYFLSTINNLVVTVSLAVLLIDLIVRRSSSADTRLIRRALFLFIVAAIYENLSPYLRLPYYNIEPFVFVILMVALGTVAARRTLAREQQLSVIEKELELAQQIQRSILPPEFPPSQHFRVGACYQPMTSVAGDMYDYLLPSEHEAGLLIGDVSGHGVPAAMIASMVKLAATTQRQVAADPAAVLRGMNSALFGNTQQQFVTAGYVHLNAQTKELRYAAAAHPPMLLLRDGLLTEVEENGLMLALFDFADYSTRALRLCAGDRLILYTDGLLEAENAAGEALGAARLHAAVLATRTLPVKAAAEHITAAAQNWSPVQTDDLTVLVCEFLG